jgi:hypothetical protein
MVKNLEWQPIATAPTDGTHIWAYLFDSGIQLMRFGTAAEWAEKEGGKPEDFLSCWVEVNDETEVWSPKYWLPKDAIPLPEAA